jgi:hypothetical protein
VIVWYTVPCWFFIVVRLGVLLGIVPVRSSIIRFACRGSPQKRVEGVTVASGDKLGMVVRGSARGEGEERADRMSQRLMWMFEIHPFRKASCEMHSVLCAMD